ncbi:MAG: sensor histidine kinase, partial [Clostridia bacterium]|nr:sensor histidine kinase [Clostridia bacterium]
DGISTGNHDRLFDRFVRSDNSRNSKTGGHGIGLSVAKAIAETHKAIVSAFSPNGKILNISIIFR